MAAILRYLYLKTAKIQNKSAKKFGSVAPLKSLYFHWTAICSSSIVFTPHSLFLLFVLLFSGLIVEDLTTAATSPKTFVICINRNISKLPLQFSLLN